MDIYNEAKTEILEDYDLEKGFLKEDTITIHHDALPYIERKTHYKVIRTYQNGSEDVETVVDVEGQDARPAYDETVGIFVYVPYSAEELARRQDEKELEECHRYLDDTDWCVIKCLEYGATMQELYPEVKARREQARARINQIESSSVTG